MTLVRRLRLFSLAGLAGLTGLGSLLAVISLNAGGAISVGRIDLFPIAAGYDRRAALDVDPAQPLTPAAFEDARKRSRAAIAQFPYDTGAYLRLAYLDQQQHGRLTATGVAALKTSYDLVAAEPDFGVWRVGTALQNFESLPEPLREQVRQEVEVLWTVSRDRERLRKLPSQLTDFRGRLSLALWIKLIELEGVK